MFLNLFIVKINSRTFILTFKLCGLIKLKLLFFSLNNNCATKGLFLICVLLSYVVCGQNDYERFVDSADNHIDESSIKALEFLDSIPQPIHHYIEGRVADYYSIKALIHDDFNETAKVYQSNILALKYAEVEENYEVAGASSLDIFSNLYFVKRDSTANIYLEKAKEYYSKGNYKNGLLEIEQVRAYIKFLDSEFGACNDLIFEHLDDYKNVKDDAYYYMFALYMLTSNYIYLDDLDDAHKYYKTFKSLKEDPTIVPYNFQSFEATINVCFADVFYEKKQIDSTFHYLDLASKHRKSMGEDTIESYFTINADVHKYTGNIEGARAYLDSLIIFEEKMLKNIVDASLHINNTLLNTESELKSESKNKFYFGVFGVTLFFILAGVSLVYFLFYKKQKLKLNHLSTQAESLSYLKNNNEKLTVKVQGLEDYINSLKNQVKSIASIEDVTVQKEKIKDFYKNLHLNSSTILDEGKNHLELVNDFNIDFFKSLKNSYPNLNDSDIIICYYIFIGFKNKEIAVFLNTTVRAIESKRYRISKKMKLDKQETTLTEFLKDTFIDT